MSNDDRDPLEDPRVGDQWITPTGRVWRVDAVRDGEIWLLCPWGYLYSFDVDEFIGWVSGWRVVCAVQS